MTVLPDAISVDIADYYVTGANGKTAASAVFILDVHFGLRARWTVRRSHEEFERLHALCEDVFDEDAPLPYFPEPALPAGLTSPAVSAARQKAALTIHMEALRTYLGQLLTEWPTWDRRRHLASVDPVFAPVPHPDPTDPGTLSLPIAVIEFLNLAAHIDAGAAYRAVAKRRVGPPHFAAAPSHAPAAASHDPRSLPSLLAAMAPAESETPARIRRRVSFAPDVKPV